MRPRKFIVIVNPGGGARRALRVLDIVKPVFAAASATLRVHVTTHAGHAAELAGTLALDGHDGFCLIGGDGTIHEVVGGLMKREPPATVPLGIIPGGTGNDVARHFGLSDPTDAARRIVAGGLRPLDVARVRQGRDTAYGVNIVGWGAVVDINRTAERLRALGPPRYSVAALAYILRARRRRARLVLDGRALDGEFLFAAACNTRFTGRGMQLAPRADSADGKLDLVLVRHATRWQMMTLFRRVFDGSHVTLPFVEYHQIRTFAIESEGIDGLNLDGELRGSTPVTVDVIPAALNIFV